MEHSQSILLTLLTNSISQLSIATESTLRSINQPIYPNGVCSDTQTLGQQIKETFGIFSSSLFLHNSNKWLKLKSIAQILFQFRSQFSLNLMQNWQNIMESISYPDDSSNFAQRALKWNSSSSISATHSPEVIHSHTHTKYLSL